MQAQERHDVQHTEDTEIKVSHFIPSVELKGSRAQKLENSISSSPISSGFGGVLLATLRARTARSMDPAVAFPLPFGHGLPEELP